MKYRQFIVGESLGMIFSTIIILIGIAIFGEPNTEEEINSSPGIAVNTVDARESFVTPSVYKELLITNHEDSSDTGLDTSMPPF